MLFPLPIGSHPVSSLKRRTIPYKLVPVLQSISISWESAGYTNFLALLQTHEWETPRTGTRIGTMFYVLTSPLGDSDAHQHLRSTPWSWLRDRCRFVRMGTTLCLQWLKAGRTLPLGTNKGNIPRVNPSPLKVPAWEIAPMPKQFTFSF